MFAFILRDVGDCEKIYFTHSNECIYGCLACAGLSVHFVGDVSLIGVENIEQIISSCGDKVLPRLVPAKDNLSMLTPHQLKMYNLFYGNGRSIKPLQKSDIHPAKMIDFLPNIWMCNLLCKEKQIIDIQIRLLGTWLVENIGERTGEKMLSNQSENSFSKSRPGAFARTVGGIDLAYKLAEPVIYFSKVFDKYKSFYHSKGLVFPVCHNSESVNMVIGHTDINAS